MKKYNKIIIALALTAVMVFGVGCTKKDTTIVEEGTNVGEQTEDPNEVIDDNKEIEYLVMSTNAEFPPYEFREGGEIVGIDVDIAKAIAEHMGKELVIEDMNFDSVIAAVQSGKSDMAVSGITITEDRLVNVDFSEPYFTASQLIIVKEDNADIKTSDDLVNKTIGVQLGTTGDLDASEIEGATIERYNKGYEAVQALVQGKVDAVVIDDQVAKALTKETAGLLVIDEPFTVEEYAIAIAKGNEELKTAADAVIIELKESGKLQEIFDTYITEE